MHAPASSHDGRLHAFSWVGVVVAAAIVAAAIGNEKIRCWLEDDEPCWCRDTAEARAACRAEMLDSELKKAVVINASLARVTNVPPKSQPQKEKKAPPPPPEEKKVEGSAKNPTPRDPEKKPKEKPVEQKPPPDKLPSFDDLKKKRQKDDEDLEYGEEKPEGKFDPNAKPNKLATGDGSGTKYQQELLADLLEAAGEFPAISGAGKVEACFVLEASGKLSKVELRTRSKNEDLNLWAEKGLKGLQKKRKDDPIPPTTTADREMLEAWQCFVFKA